MTALAEGNLLATVFFVITFGIALTYVRARQDDLAETVELHTGHRVHRRALTRCSPYRGL